MYSVELSYSLELGLIVHYKKGPGTLTKYYKSGLSKEVVKFIEDWLYQGILPSY